MLENKIIGRKMIATTHIRIATEKKRAIKSIEPSAKARGIKGFIMDSSIAESSLKWKLSPLRQAALKETCISLRRGGAQEL